MADIDKLFGQIADLFQNVDEDEFEEWNNYYDEEADEDEGLTFSVCDDCGIALGKPNDNKFQTHMALQNHKCDAKKKLQRKVESISGGIK